MAGPDEEAIVRVCSLHSAYHYLSNIGSDELQSVLQCPLFRVLSSTQTRAIIKVREQLRDWDSHKHINNPQIKH